MNLQTNLHDFQWIGEDDLSSTSAATSENLQWQIVSLIGTTESTSQKVIDDQLDGFFRSDTCRRDSREWEGERGSYGEERKRTDELRSKTTVETLESFIVECLTEAIDRVCVLGGTRNSFATTLFLWR